MAGVTKEQVIEFIENMSVLDLAGLARAIITARPDGRLAPPNRMAPEAGNHPTFNWALGQRRETVGGRG